MRSRLPTAVLCILALPTTAFADTGDRAGSAGISGLWVLANFCYAGMRAQAHHSSGWRIVSFILGFPGTLVSMLVIEEGGERAYGVDLPRVDRTSRPKRVPSDFAP
jgi:hypothetical protein